MVRAAGAALSGAPPPRRVFLLGIVSGRHRPQRVHRAGIRGCRGARQWGLGARDWAREATQTLTGDTGEVAPASRELLLPVVPTRDVPWDRSRDLFPSQAFCVILA